MKLFNFGLAAALGSRPSPTTPTSRLISGRLADLGGRPANVPVPPSQR